MQTSQHRRPLYQRSQRRIAFIVPRSFKAEAHHFRLSLYGRALDEHWHACIAAFLSETQDYSGSVRSRDSYRYTLSAFFSDPARNPDSYSQADVRAFMDSPGRLHYRRGEPVKPGTKNHRLMVLSAFYKFAAAYEVDGQPLLQTKPPTLGLKYYKVGYSPRGMTAGELVRFFSVIPTDTVKGIRDRAMFLTYFWTGRRRSEIARLYWRDLESAVIVEPDGTRRPGMIYRYVAKGKSRLVQTAELPEMAWSAIDAYLVASGRKATIQPDDPLFVSIEPGHPHLDDNNPPLNGHYIGMLFKAYAKQAGLPARYSLHTLRHTAAQERHRAGSRILELQTFLGHSSLETTRRYLEGLTGIADTGAARLKEKFGRL